MRTLAIKFKQSELTISLAIELCDRYFLNTQGNTDVEAVGCLVIASKFNENDKYGILIK